MKLPPAPTLSLGVSSLGQGGSGQKSISLELLEDVFVPSPPPTHPLPWG